MLSSYNPLASPPPARRKKRHHPSKLTESTVTEALHCNDQISTHVDDTDTALHNDKIAATNHETITTTTTLLNTEMLTEESSQLLQSVCGEDMVIPDTTDNKNIIGLVEPTTAGDIVVYGNVDDTVGMGSEELFDNTNKTINFNQAENPPSMGIQSLNSKERPIKTYGKQTIYSSTEDSTKIQTSSEKQTEGTLTQLQTNKHFKKVEKDSNKLEISFVPDRYILHHIKDGKHHLSQMQSVKSTREDSNQADIDVPVCKKNLKESKKNEQSFLGNECDEDTRLKYETACPHNNEFDSEGITTNYKRKTQQETQLYQPGVKNTASKSSSSRIIKKKVNDQEVTTIFEKKTLVEDTTWLSTSRFVKTIDVRVGESDAEIATTSYTKKIEKQTLLSNQIEKVKDEDTTTGKQSSRIVKTIDIIDISSDDEELEKDGGNDIDISDDDATLSLSDNDYQTDDGKEEEPSQVF